MKTSVKNNLLKGGVLLIVLLVAVFIYLMLAISEISEQSSSLRYSPPKFDKNHSISLVYELQSLTLASSVAALNTTTNATSDFDKVTSFLPRIRQIRQELQVSELNKVAAPTEMKNALGRFINLTKANEEAIERFKTTHAAMRNSQRYLPVSYGVLLRLSDKENVKDKNNIKNSGQLDRIKTLNLQINTFLRNPSPIIKEKVSRQLSELEENAMMFSQPISNALLNYVSHAFVLVERKIPLTDILERISDDSIQDIDNEIVTIYQQMVTTQQSAFAAQEQVLNEQYVLYKNIALLLGIILALLGVLGYIIAIQEKLTATKNLTLMAKKKDVEYSKQTQLLEKSHVSTSSDANMSYVSRMVASLTHEINTPLGYLSSNMDILGSSGKAIKEIIDETEHCTESLLNNKDEAQREKSIKQLSETVEALKEESLLDELPEIISDMNTGVEQIQHLINDLKLFSGTDRAKKEFFNLNECIMDVLKLSSVILGSDISILKKFGNLPDFYGSRGKITQIFSNLVNNSAYAIKEGKPGKGVIKIVTLSKGNLILIEFMDNGIGIESENSRKVFEPFFTTKEPSKGTGLGLAIVSQIVQEHKGKIVVHSKLGQGTSFKLAFPIKK